MRKIAVAELKKQAQIDSIVLLSLSPSLYTMRAVIAGEEFSVREHQQGIRRSSAEALKQLLLGVPVGEYRLRHDSPYDEMLGQPASAGNHLEVSVAPPAATPAVFFLKSHS